MPGWRVRYGGVEITAYAGLDIQDHRLTPDDLDRTIYIRREGLLVVEALNRSVTHTAYHVGQIVYLARHLAWPEWQSLSIPKGQSAKVGTGTFKTTGLTRPTPETPR